MNPATLKRRGFNVAEMRRLARRTLPRAVFDFADGAAEDEKTLRRNEAAFDEIALLPRPLDGSPSRDLSITLFGQKLSMPLIVGPTGLAGLFWPNGERCTALAAAAAGTAYCLSHGSVCTMEELASSGAAPRWMQVFVYSDRGLTQAFAERAASANYDALVLTIDNQLLGNRERDIRNGFTIPPNFGPLALAEMTLKAGWLWRMRRELRRLTFGNYVRPGETAALGTLAARMSSLLDPTMTWDDVEALRRTWKGSLILKGILHPSEAKIAIDHGVDGVVVSNHGGRQLDGAQSSISALPAIIDAVGGDIEVHFDGGIRSGQDVLKAICMGAKGAYIGRAFIYGLAAKGEAGVRQALDIIHNELDITMALCGERLLANLGHHNLLDPALFSSR